MKLLWCHTDTKKKENKLHHIEVGIRQKIKVKTCAYEYFVCQAFRTIAQMLSELWTSVHIDICSPIPLRESQLVLIDAMLHVAQSRNTFKVNNCRDNSPPLEKIFTFLVLWSPQRIDKRQWC